MEQHISSFLDRFHPKNDREVAILREVHQSLAAGRPLEEQYLNFLALGDCELLRHFYHSCPTLRDQILAHPNCPPELKPQSKASVGNHPLLKLDFEIDLDLSGLIDYEAGLPPGEIDGDAKTGCQSRIDNLRRLFDRVPSTLHETDFTNTEDSLFYDLLTAKQRINTNQGRFSKLRIALLRRFVNKEAEKEDIPEDPTTEQPPEPEEQEAEDEEIPDQGLDEEYWASLMAEEEALAQLEAKAEKKAADQKRQQRLREQAKAQEERSIQEQRSREEAGQQSGSQPDSPQPFVPPYEYAQPPAYTIPEENARPLTGQAEYEGYQPQRETVSQAVPTEAHTPYESAAPYAYPKQAEVPRQPQNDPQVHPAQPVYQTEMRPAYEYTVPPAHAEPSEAPKQSQGYQQDVPVQKDPHHSQYPSEPVRSPTPADTRLSYEYTVPPTHTEPSEAPKQPEDYRQNEPVQKDPHPSQYQSEPVRSVTPADSRPSYEYTVPPMHAEPFEAPKQSQPYHPVDSYPKETEYPKQTTPADIHSSYESDRYRDQAEVLRRQENRRRDEVYEEDLHHRSEVRAGQAENLRSYEERMDRSRSYESFGTSHIDFSGKAGHAPNPEPDSQAKPHDVHTPDQSLPERERPPKSHSADSVSHPEPRPESSPEQTRQRQYDLHQTASSERQGQGPYTVAPIGKPTEPEPVRTLRETVDRQASPSANSGSQKNSIQPESLRSTSREEARHTAYTDSRPSNETRSEYRSRQQNYRDEFLTRPKADTSRYPVDPKEGMAPGQTREYRQDRANPSSKQRTDIPVFRPYSYAPGGAVLPVVGPVAPENAPSNQEIYQSVSARGSITPEQSQAMRFNLNHLRQACDSAKGTPEYAQAVQSYNEARQAVLSVNRDLRSKQITFDHGSTPATVPTNVTPLRRSQQLDGVTLYQYTPSGVRGTPAQNTSAGGGVVYHNPPGTTGKAVLSVSSPLLVTKAYEDTLHRDAQLAKQQLKERLRPPVAGEISTKLNAVELNAYMTAMDAYAGFRRAKAEGLVQVTTATNAHNTPDQKAWAARQQTYRQTIAQHQQQQQRRSEGEKIAPKLKIDLPPRTTRTQEQHTPSPLPRPNNQGVPHQTHTNDFKSRFTIPKMPLAPFGSVFSINYNRGKYTTGEKEITTNLLNTKSKLQRSSIMRNMGDRLYHNFTLYAPEFGRLATRKLYTMVQAGSDPAPQTLRTFEDLRYYSVVGTGVVLAHATRNVGSLKRFDRQAAKNEVHNFGFTRSLSYKDISKKLHTRMNESRNAKKDIRRMYERESGLSAQERRVLADKLNGHKALRKDTERLAGLQRARLREKVQRNVLKELHLNQKDYGLVTEQALKDLQVQRKQIQQQRRAILRENPEHKALNKRLNELRKKGKGNLSAEDLEELKSIRSKLSKISSDPRLKALDRKETEILKRFKTKPEETAVARKQLRLKDVNKTRERILSEHFASERLKFPEFANIKTSVIEKNKKALEKESEILKQKIKNLKAKGALTGQDPKQMRALSRTSPKGLNANHTLTASERRELDKLMKRLKANQEKIKSHASVLELRDLLKMKLDAIDKVRKALQKNQQRMRMGKLALIGYITRPLNEGDNIGAQGLAKGISLGSNPYVHRLVRKTVHTAMRFASFAARKIGKWTGLDKKMTPVVDKAKQFAANVRKVANTPKEYQKKLIKTSREATKRAVDRMTPQFVKTGRQMVRNKVSSLVTKLQKSKLGKAYESVARTLSKIKAAVGTAMKAVTAFLWKFLLVFLIIFLFVGLITVIGGGVGGSVPSFLIMGDESNGEKIDLAPYYEIIVDEWNDYLDDLKGKKSEGYYKVIVNMDPQPANARNILSMMAVRMSQDLDLEKNPAIEPYLRSLTRDANPYTTQVTTCYCAGRNCQSYGHTEDCPVRCTSSHAFCPGDHKVLTINIKPLYFNEIFYADTSANANLNYASGDLIGYFKITHYCLENYPHICNDGDSSTTASGTKPTPNYTIATDPSVIETGTPVIIDGKTYMAEDTGGAIDGYRIDIAVKTHAEALQLGTRYNVPVYAADYTGEGIQSSGEWNGWVAENRDWAKTIYSAPWNELYTGIPNVTDTVGNETDLSGVNFINGSRIGNQAIVDCALSQLGNTGGQPYWSWYGFDSRVEWCATFVSWCANQQGVLGTAIPRFCSCSLEGVPWFQEHNQWATAGSSYIPVAGDIIFFDWQSDGRPDHVGIVVGSDGTKVYTVEGNSSDAVRTKSYRLDSSVLFGYGLPNY